jgi:hypothetical protein
LYPVSDPQAVREPRPDTSYYQSGLSGLQITNIPGPLLDEDGYPAGGSRVFQWGWAPVGGASGFDALLTPNALAVICEVGTVTIT